MFPAEGFGTEVSHLWSTEWNAVCETLLFFLLHRWKTGCHSIHSKTNKLSQKANFVSPDTAR